MTAPEKPRNEKYQKTGPLDRQAKFKIRRAVLAYAEALQHRTVI